MDIRLVEAIPLTLTGVYILGMPDLFSGKRFSCKRSSRSFILHALSFFPRNFERLVSRDGALPLHVLPCWELWQNPMIFCCQNSTFCDT